MNEERMIRGRTVVHTTTGKFYSKVTETPENQLKRTLDLFDNGEVWKANAFTLDTVVGPLYVNLAHIVAVEFEEV